MVPITGERILENNFIIEMNNVIVVAEGVTVARIPITAKES